MSRVVGVKPYVLRYWESEFPKVSPKKSGTGHRLYRRKDVELLLEIKRLLYDNRFTIEGARKHIDGLNRKEKAKAQAPQPSQAELFHPADDLMEEMRRELREILSILR